MTRFIGTLQIGVAILLYLISAVTFIDYMYSLTIRDTVTAIENAFGTLVVLIFMLVLAKFTLAAGRKKLRGEGDGQSTLSEINDPVENGVDPDQTERGEETEK